MSPNLFSLVGRLYTLYQPKLLAFRYFLLLVILIYCVLVDMSNNPSTIEDNILVGFSQPGICNKQNDFYRVVQLPAFVTSSEGSFHMTNK